MVYCEDCVKELNIAYIGGGSRGWAWGLMSDIAVESKLSGTVKLYDIDYEAAMNNEQIGNSLNNREDVTGKWNYQAVKTLEDALRGADFVIISILPGTFMEMNSDVHLPENYGIYQSVGDSTGPGGIIRALRTIPMYVEIANAIRKYSPKAWVINYTNPMSICVRILYRTFPEIKAFGCCHEVFGTQKLLAQMLQEMKGIPEPERGDIKVNVLGINHFTWLNQASYQGEDLFPLYEEFVDKYYVTGYEGVKTGHWINDSFSSANLVKFDLFRRYGWIAAAGDRHLAEFVPNSWYLKDPDTVKYWKFGLTTVNYRMENLKSRQAKSKAYLTGQETFQLKSTGEEGVRQIKALLGLEDLITNVNLPNTGQMKAIPTGAIVETNALFQYDRILPVYAGKMPPAIHNLTIRNVMNQETIVESMINEDKNSIFNAFLNDPLASPLSTIDGNKLFEDMLKNTSNYLPEFLL